MTPRTKSPKNNNIFEQASIRLTTWVGSTTSIIVHTLVFFGIFGLYFFNIALDQILLLLTTAVSLEAIYLAIFIQMTVNRNTESLEEVEENIDEIQEDVEELEKDVDEIQGDIDEIQEDVDEIAQEESKEQQQEQRINITMETIKADVEKLMRDIETLKAQK